MMKKILLSK